MIPFDSFHSLHLEIIRHISGFVPSLVDIVSFLSVSRHSSHLLQTDSFWQEVAFTHCRYWSFPYGLLQDYALDPPQTLRVSIPWRDALRRHIILLRSIPHAFPGAMSLQNIRRETHSALNTHTLQGLVLFLDQDGELRGWEDFFEEYTLFFVRIIDSVKVQFWLWPSERPIVPLPTTTYRGACCCFICFPHNSPNAVSTLRTRILPSLADYFEERSIYDLQALLVSYSDSPDTEPPDSSIDDLVRDTCFPVA